MAGDKFDAVADKYGNVPTAEPVTFGPEGRPQMTAEGMNVRNGIPYGAQIRAVEASMTRRYLFRPAVKARLQAATRRALGR